jgi:SAM-dependent methyltransferase
MAKTKTVKQKNKVIQKLVKLDLGCGPNPQPGFIGVDQYNMKGVDVVCNLGSGKWPWKDNTVDEVYCAHFLEHLTNLGEKWERTHFFNELYRVLRKGGKATLIFPHWCSNRYYGDPTHKEPFSEMGFYYLSKDWRATQAPHSDKQWNKHGYDCDFDASWGYNLRQDIVTRNQEFQQNAMANYKEVIQDIIATLVKK